MSAAFGPFVLDVRARRLTRDGREVHLSRKAFDLLVLLVERAPAVVDKAAIRERLWPGVHVVDASLSNLVAELRGVLDAGRDRGSAIRTVHGVGYGFEWEVGSAPGAAAPAASSTARARASCWLTFKERRVLLADGENLVGRDAACPVWLDASSVSRRHARIRVRGAQATIEDLDSTNGTFVDGQRVTTAVPLDDGQRLRFGRVTVEFRTSRGTDAPTRRVR